MPGILRIPWGQLLVLPSTIQVVKLNGKLSGVKLVTRVGLFRKQGLVT